MEFTTHLVLHYQATRLFGKAFYRKTMVNGPGTLYGYIGPIQDGLERIVYYNR